MCSFLPFMKRTSSVLAEDLLDALADSLCIHIHYYNDATKDFYKFKPKSQIFYKPIVLEVKGNSVYLLYTQGQAYTFANTTSRDTFSRSSMLNKEISKAQETASEAFKAEVAAYANTVKALFSLFDDLLERLCKFFESVYVFSTSGEAEQLKSAFPALLSSEFVQSGIISNPLLQKVIPDFMSKMDQRIPYFVNGAHLNKAFDHITSTQPAHAKLSNPYDLLSSQSKKCASCKNPCEPFKSYRLICGHILDDKCFET